MRAPPRLACHVPLAAHRRRGRRRDYDEHVQRLTLAPLAAPFVCVCVSVYLCVCVRVLVLVRFSIAVYGDMGATESEETIASLVARRTSYNFVLHIGDFGYSDDNLNTSNFEPIWNQWQGMIEPIAVGAPCVACNSAAAVASDTTLEQRARACARVCVCVWVCVLLLRVFLRVAVAAVVAVLSAARMHVTAGEQGVHGRARQPRGVLPRVWGHLLPRAVHQLHGIQLPLPHACRGVWVRDKHVEQL